MVFEQQTPLKLHTTMRVGGDARLSVAPANSEELASAVAYCRQNGIRFIILGNGSNIVFADSGFDGCVIFTTKLQSIGINGNTITAGAGAALSSLSSTALKNSLSGLEFAYGIPGSVGGAVYMNAGAYGGEISQIFDRCTVICRDGSTKVLCKDELDFGYRHSALQSGEYILTDATFVLTSGEQSAIKSAMDANMASRKAKQPLEFPSSGSAFKRPTGYFAAALIEQAGLKGYTVGGAQVSPKHAGFIVNLGNATASDVEMLSKYVSDNVYAKFGVRLESEIIFVR